MTQTLNEYRPLEDRKAAADMTGQELVREFAGLKVWFAVHEVTGRHPEGGRYHNRLVRVVNELRSRALLD